MKTCHKTKHDTVLPISSSCQYFFYSRRDKQIKSTTPKLFKRRTNTLDTRLVHADAVVVDGQVPGARVQVLHQRHVHAPVVDEAPLAMHQRQGKRLLHLARRKALHLQLIRRILWLGWRGTVLRAANKEKITKS